LKIGPFLNEDSSIAKANPVSISIPEFFSLKVDNKTYHIAFLRVSTLFGEENQWVMVCVVKRASPVSFFSGVAGHKHDEENHPDMARRIAFHRAIRNLACEDMRRDELEVFDESGLHLLTNLTNGYYSMFRQAAREALKAK
jgi:hypothetical protein